MNDRLNNINFCRCCLLDFIGSDFDNPPLNMQNETFAHGNQKISFFDGYFDVNNSSIEDFPSVPVSEVQICSLCVVHLESAYIFKKLCLETNEILRRKYSRYDDATNQIKCELMDNEDEAEMSSGSAKMSTIQTETRVAEDKSDQEIKIEKLEDTVFPAVNSGPRRDYLRKRKIVKKSRKPHNKPNKLTNDEAGTSTCSTKKSNIGSEETSDHETEIEKLEETDFITVKSVSSRRRKVVAKSNESNNEKHKPSKAASTKKQTEIVNLGSRYACKLCTKVYSTQCALNTHNRNEGPNINFCRCCLSDFIGSDNPPINMQNEAFVYGNQRISFVDGYFDVNNSSIEDFPSVPVSEVQICSLCVVQLESAYVFKKLCQEANTILRQKYSRYDDATNQIKCELMDNEDEAEMSSGSVKISTIKNETCVAEDSSDQEIKIEKFKEIVFPIVRYSEPRRTYSRKKEIDKKSRKPHNEPNQFTNYEAGMSTCSTKKSNIESEETSDQETEIEKLEETDFTTVKSAPLSKIKVVAKSNEPNNEKHKLLLTNYKFQKSSKIDSKKKHTEIVKLGIRYACKLCTKAYSSPGDLNRHNRSKHLNKSHPCHLCEKKFTVNSSRQRHIKNIHINT